MVALSCSGFSATTSCAVEQFGLAMRFFLGKPESASAFPAGTISGQWESYRHPEEFSITAPPCAAIFGDHSLDTLPPADIRHMSTPEKSVCSSALHFRILSPNETSVPWLRREATAITSSAGKRRSSRMLSISRPTFPVAPTTATLKPMTLSESGNSFEHDPYPKTGSHFSGIMLGTRF